MANLIIKPSAGGQLILKDEGDSAAITVATNGTTTFAENATLSGTGNNLGTVTAGTIASGVTGGAGLDGSYSGANYFRAKYSNSEWLTLSGGTILAFNTEQVDDGNNYNTSTYKYTAPLTGVYIFGAICYTANSDTSNGFTLAIDGSGVTFANSSTYFSYGEGDDDFAQGANLIIKLNVSQTVEVQATTSSDLYTGNSFWWGCQLR